MSTNIITRFTLAALATTVLSIGIPAANHAGESDKAAAVDYTKMSPEALAEHLMLNTSSFKLEQPVQEGGTAGKRRQDLLNGYGSGAGYRHHL